MYVSTEKDGDGSVSVTEIKFFIEEVKRIVLGQYELALAKGKQLKTRVLTKTNGVVDYVQNTAVFVKVNSRL